MTHYGQTGSSIKSVEVSVAKLVVQQILKLICSAMSQPDEGATFSFITSQQIRRTQCSGKHCLQYVLLIAFSWQFRTELGKFITVLIFWMYVTLDGLLARFAGWGIRNIPKSFDWSIGSINIRPSWSSAYPSEIVVTHWTWHNPKSSRMAAFHSPYLLHVDRLSFRLDLNSIHSALRDRYTNPIKVHEISLEGVRFYAKRNKTDALNLWVALDLPDQVR